MPGQVLKRLKIKTITREGISFGKRKHYNAQKGAALFKYGGSNGYAEVIFQENEDATLPGALTPDALGLVLDPLRRKPKPLPMILAHLI